MLDPCALGRYFRLFLAILIPRGRISTARERSLSNL